MRNLFPMLVCFLALGSIASGDDKELKKLDGTWVVETGELSGQKLPDEFAKSVKLTITDGKYSVSLGAESDKGTITVDSAKSPKSMDIVSKEGPNAGKTILCIYEMKDDTVKICYSFDGKDRPKEFKSTAENKCLLITYKKEKK